MLADPDKLIGRFLETVVEERLRESPVVVLTGPRTVGKSTLVASLAARNGVPVYDLDDLAMRRNVIDDPGLFVSGLAEPVCIDEFQHAPELLDAIKFQLNRDFRPGRYLLTGSTRYHTLPQASQSLTGRAQILNVWPLSQGELRGERETFLDTLLQSPDELRQARSSTTTRTEYEQTILAGGFPIALARSNAADRIRWFDSFIELVILRDVLSIKRVQQRGALPVLLRHLAARTGQILNVSDIADRMNIESRTLREYVTLLESVFMIHRLEAFSRTLSSRVAKSPKTHMIDTGLSAHLLGVTERRLRLRQPAALTEFGHLVETFAVNEIVKQSEWAESIVRFSHFRTKDKAEVDLVAETHDGAVAGIEVKASATVKDADFAGLRLLRDRLGDDFTAGVVLNLGERSYRYDDRLYVVAMDRLWSLDHGARTAPTPPRPQSHRLRQNLGRSRSARKCGMPRLKCSSFNSITSNAVLRRTSRPVDSSSLTNSSSVSS